MSGPQTARRPLANRPQDYYYDNTFTVSSRKDHVKQMRAALDHSVAFVPEYANMFARAPNYPSVHYEYRNHPLPSNVGQNRLPAKESANVTGQNRYKYFRKPFIPYLPSTGGQVVYAKRVRRTADEDQEKQAAVARPPSPPTKTVGIQTLYRESETQTDPYSPDYVVPPGTQPEILALATLTFNAGLPAGIAELEMIERARAKRAWEATLPQVKDQDSFDKRLKMMEEMELREWAEREAEIKRLQDTRLEILTKLIRKREAENEELNNDRIEKIWQRKLQERDALHEKIEKKRMKALRKVTERRKNVENIVERRDIIADYANYASRVYAPKARDGAFQGTASDTLQIKDTGMLTYEGLEHIESTVPEHLMKPNLSRPAKPTFRTPSARRELHIYEQLRFVDQKLKERKNMKPPEVKPLKYAQRIEKPVQRPQTPKIELPEDPEEDGKNFAAITLQRLLRGRAMQNIMYQGKERRLQLINELRTRQSIQRAEEDVAVQRQIPVRTVQGVSESSVSISTSSISSRSASSATSVKSVEKVSSIHALELAVVGSERVSSASSLKEPVKAPSVRDVVAMEEEKPTKETERKEENGKDHEIDQARRLEEQFAAATIIDRPFDNVAPYTDESNQLEQLYEMAIQGEYVGQALDFLSKELTRLREERRISAIVKLAERERRMREAEESGKRQAELKRRKEEDELFRQVMHVHQETVDTYLEDLFLKGIDNTATVQARAEVRDFAANVNRIVDRLEERNVEENVSDLISSFLLPEVERQAVRQQVKQEQRKYLLAAHKAIYGQMSTIEGLEKVVVPAGQEDVVSGSSDNVGEERVEGDKITQVKGNDINETEREKE